MEKMRNCKYPGILGMTNQKMKMSEFWDSVIVPEHIWGYSLSLGHWVFGDILGALPHFEIKCPFIL